MILDLKLKNSKISKIIIIHLIIKNNKIKILELNNMAFVF